MENRNDDVRNFEGDLKLLMKGYVNDYNDLSYIICYLCLVDSKLENRPYNSFDEEYISTNNNSFDAFINAVEKRFSKLDCGQFKSNIDESINYLKDFRFGNIDGRDLLRLLKTKDLYFYENILITNAFGKENDVFHYRNDGTPIELIELFKFFKIGSKYLDVGCGNGNVLVGLSYNSNIKGQADGIEINPRNALISKLRLSLCHDFDSDIVLGDYLTTHIEKKYSFITINMPFGLHISTMKRNELNVFKNDFRFDWSITPASSSEWVYVNKALKLLDKNGRIALVTAQTPLFKTGDIKLRKDLIDNNLIEYVIDMPVNTYPNSMVNYSVVIFSNNKKDDVVKFVNASECFVSQKNNRKLDVDKLLKKIETSDEVKAINNSVIKDNNYMLLTTKYSDEESKSKLKKSTKLSDLSVEVTRGFQLFSKSDLKKDGKYSIVTISDIDDNGNIVDNLGRFDTDKDIDKFLLKENDILISTKGTRIKTCLVSNLKNINTVYHGNLSLIRIKDDRLDPVFLKLYLDSERGQLELKSIQTGATIISINTSQLSNISIPLLSIDEQRKIVNEYVFKKNEIDVLSNRLNDLKNDLSDSVNQVFEGVKE